MAQEVIGRPSSQDAEKATPTKDLAREADLMKKLPRLPTPDYLSQFGECSVGSLVVLLIAAVVVFGVWYITAGEEFDENLRLVFFSIVCGEAAMAVFCLLALLFGDPGVIKRRSSTCFPMPPEVENRILASQEMPRTNVRNSGGRSYCVRCCVWREVSKEGVAKGRVTKLIDAAPSCGIIDADSEYQAGHHCGVCQRCVRDFDHHCGFYGRCITKKNMIYFKGVINIGLFTGFTLLCFIPVILKIQIGTGAFIVSLIAVLCIFALGVCCCVCSQCFDC